MYTLTKNKWKELQRSSKLLNIISKKEYAEKQMEQAWKKIELNKKYMGQALALQEGATVIGPKLAYCTNRPEYMWCRKCFKVIETLDHVLTTCTGRRKEIIARHDEVGKEIYRLLGKKYGLCEHYINNPRIIEKNNIKLIWNKKTLKTPNYNTKNQPDITLIDKNKE